MLSILMSFVLMLGPVLQEVQYGYNKGATGVSHTFSFNAQIAGNAVCTLSSSDTVCTTTISPSTTAGHIEMIYLLWMAANSSDTNHIVSAYDCNAGSGTCTAGNAIDTFTIASGTLNNAQASFGCGVSENVSEVAYVINGAGGANRLTITTASSQDPGACAGNQVFTAVDDFTVSANPSTVVADTFAQSVAEASCTCTLGYTFTGGNVTGSSDLIYVQNGACVGSTVSPSPWVKTAASGADAYYALNVGSSVAQPISTQTSGCGVFGAVALK